MAPAASSYATLQMQADGGSSRPQSAAHSRRRIDTAAAGGGAGSPGVVKVFSNTLYDAGDILGAQHASEAAAAAPVLPPSRGGLGSAPQAPPPRSPLVASGGSQKFQQQRVLAAQKRLERLQMGGLAQSNETIAVVTLAGGSSSRPGTPKAAGSTAAHMMPAPPAGPGSSRSYRAMRAGNTSSGGGWGAAAAAAVDAAGPPPGRTGAAAQQQQQQAWGADDTDEDLEVETLGEPVRPGTASAPRVTSAGGSNNQQAAGAASAPTQKHPQRAVVDLSDVLAFLRRPAPPASAGVVMCCIERVKGGMGKPPTYRFHLELPSGGYRLLLAARKRLKTATSSYVISTSADDLSRHSSSCIAKLRSNLVGTAFTIVAVNGGSSSHSSSAGSSRPASAALAAGGKQPGAHQQLAGSSAGMQQSQRRMQQQSSSGSGRSRGSQDGDAHAAWQQGGGGGGGEPSAGGRQELGAVMYETNVLGTRGPRRMSAAVPAVDGNNLPWLSSGAQQDGIVERVRAGACDGLVVLHNKAPKWSEALGAYCLNFNGRVTEASVKNFQLATADAPDAVVLQFGKVSETTFTCDFSWPLSPLQAFAVCLSSFDNKLACE